MHAQIDYWKKIDLIITIKKPELWIKKENLSVISLSSAASNFQFVFSMNFYKK
jgi:hypothetical protein